MKCPVLFIAVSEAVTRWQSQNAYKRSLDLKDIFIVDGATHFDMYHEL